MNESSICRNPKRLQNMILAIGPGTPASVLIREQISPSSLQEESSDESQASPVDVDADDDDESAPSVHTDEEDNGEEEEATSRKRNSMDEESSNSESSDGDDGEIEMEHDSSEGGSEHDDDAGSDSSSHLNQQQQRSSHCRASMRHGGCINTAAWLDCPWRLSHARTDDNSFLNSLIISSSHSSNANPLEPVERASPARAIPSLECPTQLITSGDDRMVKFWDVSSSMGSASPVPGPTTHCPFAYYSKSKPCSSSLVKEWKNRYNNGTADHIPGAVNLLASLMTGHRGNVFHVTPLPSKAGKVLTCAADGHLNLCDAETDSVSTILAVEGSGLGMCFSQHMLDDNTGLLCCEKGLHRFDLRLPRSSQPSASLFGDNMCKSCAVYSASESETSAYVFGKIKYIAMLPIHSCIQFIV